MSEYLDDPSVLTKDKLKSELLAHNVELPSGNPTKDVFVQLYLKNLTVRNSDRDTTRTVDAFSSDEELPPVVVSSRSRSSGRKATRKTEKTELETLDLTALTDSDLRDELLKRGADVGPIVASTRKPYEKKLQRLLDESPAPLPPSGVQLNHNHNGNAESDIYSDKDDEVTPEPEPEPVPAPEPEPEAVVVERAVRSRGKTPVISSQHQTVEKMAAGDQTPKVEEENVLKELFPSSIKTPTGLYATARRPIRGAAGRPMISTEPWRDKNCLLSPDTTKTSHYSFNERRAVHRASCQLPSTSPPSHSASSPWCSTGAPPAGQTRTVRGSVFPWKKLVLLGIVAAFLFLVYQAMEPGSTGSFGK